MESIKMEMKKRKSQIKIGFLILIFISPLFISVGNLDKADIDKINKNIQSAARNWESIPLQNTDGTSLYNYANILSRTILFYDANQCGDQVTENNRFNWRGDCHENDSITLTLSDGSTVDIDATGGYHDAGDHIKFGITNAYAASTLGWGFYEFRDQYEESGQDVWLLRAVKWATDYFIKCHPEPNQFVYSVGSSEDHNYWGPPELQTDERSARDVAVVTPSTPASDVCGNTAASLALMYLNYYSVDSTYAETCLQHARDLYTLGRENLGLADDNMPFYPSGSYWDDLAWGALWLYEATKEDFYYQEFLTIIGPTCMGLDTDTDLDNGINWVNQWTHCWDAVWGGVFAAASGILDHQAFKDQAKVNLDFWMTGITESPGGLAYLTDWGSLRYSTAAALCALTYYEHTNDTAYRDFGASQINYALGSNPIDRCYIVGIDETSPIHPHHDAAHGSESGFLTDPPFHKHVLYGALVGGPGVDDQHNDAIDDYVQNEVSIDYNAAIVGALAGMRKYFGTADQMPDPFPAPEDPIEAYYVQGKIELDNNERSHIIFQINNHAIHPPHYETQLSYRYFIDLSEVYDQGYSVDNINLEVTTNQDNLGKVTPYLIPFDAMNHIYYVNISYEGVALSNTKELQIGLIYSTPSFVGTWDPTNDFSHEDLTSEFSKNYKIPLYRDSVLIWGDEPYIDVIPPSKPTGLTTEVKGSAQINLNWNANIEADLSHYNIYHSLQDDFECDINTYVGQSSTLTYADTDLEAETTYYYKITAVDINDNEGIPSDVASDTTSTPDPYPPSAPQGLSEIEVTYESISLDWNDNLEVDMSKYNIYRSLSSGFICNQDSYIGMSIGSNYVDINLNSDTRYYYKVTAVDTSNNEGDPSNEISVITSSAPPANIRLQYRCTSTSDSSDRLRFDLNLFNDDEVDLLLSDVSIRYWLTSEPLLSNLVGVSDYADIGQSEISYSTGTLESFEYIEISFSTGGLIPSWLGGDGVANNFPQNSETGQMQCRIFDDVAQQLFDQTNDWSYDSSVTSFQNFLKISVYYKGVLCWGDPPTNVVDNPPSVSEPNDVEFIFGTPNMNIQWDCQDDDPDTYELYQNGILIDTQDWSSLNPIIVNLDNLAIGVYEYYIKVSDQAGNVVISAIVTVNVLDDTNPYALGDVNHDNAVNIVDALLVAQYYVGEPVNIDESLADVNLDGNINIVDALLIAQFYVGQNPSLPPQ